MVVVHKNKFVPHNLSPETWKAPMVAQYILTL